MNADSVKAKLKNFAIETGHTFQEALTYYGLERTIYRISNSSVEMKEVFKEIFAQDIDDALIFDPDSLTVEDITEFKEYHGLHVSATGYLDRTKVPVSIDIGFGDVVYPDAVKMDFPVILDMEVPRINAYSLESSIAEKLEAIIHNGYLNSRYKDFYDIYILTRKYSFSFDEMKKAVIETFDNRGTAMTMDTAAFGAEFVQDPIHQTRWRSFLKKKKAVVQVPFEAVITGVKTFAEPLFYVDSGAKDRWNSEKGSWE